VHRLLAENQPPPLSLGGTSNSSRTRGRRRLRGSPGSSASARGHERRCPASLSEAAPLATYLLVLWRLCCNEGRHVQRSATMHPYITNKLVWQQRASLAANADRHRLAGRSCGNGTRTVRPAGSRRRCAWSPAASAPP